LTKEIYLVKRWYERVDLKNSYKSTRADWNALLKKQEEQKAFGESLLQAELEDQQETRDCDWLDRSRFMDTDDSTAASKFKGQDLKVIVKASLCFWVFSVAFITDVVFQAANYILKPGQEYEGTWHLEGMVRIKSSCRVIADLPSAARAHRRLRYILLRDGC
jgi:hypothetical protein